MRRLGRVIESVANIGGHFSGWLVPLMMLLVLFEVFMRYVMGQPPMIADEFAAYMLVALSFIGLAYTWKEKGHIRITVLVNRLPPRESNWLSLVTLVFAFAFAIVLIKLSYDYMVFSFSLGMTSSTWLRFPLQGPQMTLVIGFILLSLMLIVEIATAITNIRSGRRVEEKA